MPKNYQISQYDEPIAASTATSTCRSTTAPPSGRYRACTWRRTPASSPTSGRRPAASMGTTSLLDFNRAGVPLIEIVTKPIEGTGERAPEVARAYVTALRDLLRALDVSDVRMDQAHCAVTPTCRCKAGRPGSSAPHRDQERQPAQERRGGGPLRDAPSGSGSQRRRAPSTRRPDTSTRTVTPRRAAPRDRRGLPVLPEPISSRWRPATSWSPGCGPPSRSCRGWRANAFNRSGESPTRSCTTWSTRARSIWWPRPSGTARPVTRPAHGGATSWCRRPTSQGSNSTPWRSPRRRSPGGGLVEDGTLSNKLARQVVEGVLAGEGEPEQVVADRGLAVVRDDSADPEPRSMRHWPRTRRWRRRSVAARCRRRARSSAR